MQREINEREHAGTFHSTKLGRDVRYESSLEEMIYRQLELSTQVAYYQEQPVAITYTYRGSRYRYYPDLFVVTSNGRGLFVEVKPHWQIALSRNRAKADAARTFAHQRGFGWVSVSSYGTCHDLRYYHVDPTVWRDLDTALRERPYLDWSAVKALRDRLGFNAFDVAAYTIQSNSDLELLPFRLSNPNYSQ